MAPSILDKAPRGVFHSRRINKGHGIVLSGAARGFLINNPVAGEGLTGISRGTEAHRRSLPTRLQHCIGQENLFRHREQITA